MFDGRAWRKRAGVNRIRCGDEPQLRVGQGAAAIVSIPADGPHAGAVEHDVAHFAHGPAPAAVPLQALGRRDRVDRELQRGGRHGRLVVDHPQRAVREQIDPIDDAPDGQPAGAVGAEELEHPVEPLLEPPVDDGNAALRLHPQHQIGEPRGHRRSKQPGALDARIRGAELSEAGRHDILERRARAAGRPA